MQIDWKPEHTAALREYLAGGMSHARAADAINKKFNTGYSRCAAIGRARRMGLAAADRSDQRIKPRKVKAKPPHKSRQRHAPEAPRPAPVSERAKPAKLRCVEIVPRHLALIDLEREHCRYPYGGDEDGEAISFCGHPRRAGSSYCTPHFHLTRGPGIAVEPSAITALLRLVEAA